MSGSAVRMTGARALAEMVHGYGVSNVFFVPTFAISALAEMNRLGVRTISAHGEKSAAYMADGYARVTGRPGVCMAQVVGGPLIAAGLKDAHMVGVPIVALSGGPLSSTRGRQVYQEIDDIRSFDNVTKWQQPVDDLRRLPELLRQAFRAATSGTPGPAHLQVAGPLGQLVDQEADLDVSVDDTFARTPPFRPTADGPSVQQAVAALRAAERPIIVAGQGVMASRAEAELQALAERLDVPLTTSLNAKAALADDHRLNAGVTGNYSRRSANEALARADLAFFVGSRGNSMTTTGWRLPLPATRVIQLDISADQLGRHLHAEIALHGDAKATLAAMVEIAEPRSNATWTDEVSELVSRWHDEVRPMRESTETPIRPERICAAITNALPADGAVVVDTLQASIWAGSMIHLSGPSQRFVRCGGSLGWGLPAAIGAKAGLGDRAVVCFTGDGGIYYHLAELETAARYGISVVVVVNNNGAYAGEEEYWGPAFGDTPSDSHWKFGDINFANVAHELGCDGIRVERPEDLDDALRRGLASGRPTLIDVVSDQSAYHPKGWVPS